MINVPNIVFIVPYRDRKHEKNHYSVYMKYIMEDYNPKNYEIYYSHQCDSRPFNRGATKNIGFLAIKEKYPNNYKDITFVFNDIDTVPYKKNLLDFQTTKNNVKHFYGFTYTLGGIFSILGSDFEKCNGFINNWGWGLEDNDMYDRCIKNNLNIDRNCFFKYNDKNIIQLYDSPNRVINNNDPKYYKTKIIVDDLRKINGLSYDIILNNNNDDKDVKDVKDDNNNEFIININNFNTLINPNNEKFYVQDLSKNSKLSVNQLEKQERKKMWNMNRFLNR